MTTVLTRTLSWIQITDDKDGKIPIASEHEEELAALFGRMCSASVKQLLLDTVQAHPELIRSWYKNADTEVNMETVIREKMEKANLDIDNSTRLEVDLFALGASDGWWKDESKIEEIKTRLESREHNEALNNAVLQILEILHSTLQQTRSFLERGLFELAAHCFKLVIALYMDSRASKDALISEPEEVAFVDQLISVEGLFIHSVSISYAILPFLVPISSLEPISDPYFQSFSIAYSIGVVDDARLPLHRLAPNLAHESNINRLTKHLKLQH